MPHAVTIPGKTRLHESIGSKQKPKSTNTNNHQTPVFESPSLQLREQSSPENINTMSTLDPIRQVLFISE